MHAMENSPFTSRLQTEAELRALLGEPGELVKRKQLSALDVHCRAFIALSPFLLLGTANADGECDVSPRGDAPGFVLALDNRHLVIPERPGNRRLDSLLNILQTGTAGLLFIIPGVEETLRVNGRAWVINDESLLAKMTAHGKQPVVAIGLEVRECFLHCAKAFKRSHLWQAERWPAREQLPSLAQMLMDQTCPPGITVEEMERYLAESYTKRLY